MVKLLKKKIKNKKATVGVIGLGYVGLPFAVNTALSGYKTIGFDILQRRADKVNKAIAYISDVDKNDMNEAVSKKLLKATTDYSKLKKCDVICIAVPTPLDQFKQPDTKYVEKTTEGIAKYINKDTLVILESTTYPGTTEEIVKPILEESG